MELRRLWKSDSAEVLVSTWDRAQHPVEREGCANTAVIEFMRSGSFTRVGGSHQLLIDADHASFFNPSEPFRVSHPFGDRNEGTTIRVSSDTLADILADTDPAAAHRRQRPFSLSRAVTSPRCHLLQSILIGVLRRDAPPDSLLVAELILDVVREALTGLSRNPRVGRGLQFRSNDPRWAERIEMIRQYLLFRWTERLTLEDLAQVANCSTWHLATTFRVRVGVPIHRYVKRLRLRHALQRVQDGCADLTGVALDCGFNSHSHFTAAFRQEFGLTPGAFRSLCNARTTPQAFRD